MRALVREGDGVTEMAPAAVADYRGEGFVWLHVEGDGPAGLANVPPYVPGLAANALLATETRPRCDEIAQGAIINLRGTGMAVTADSDRLVSMIPVRGLRLTSHR